MISCNATNTNGENISDYLTEDGAVFVSYLESYGEYMTLTGIHKSEKLIGEDLSCRRGLMIINTDNHSEENSYENFPRNFFWGEAAKVRVKKTLVYIQPLQVQGDALRRHREVST